MMEKNIEVTNARTSSNRKNALLLMIAGGLGFSATALYLFGRRRAKAPALAVPLREQPVDDRGTSQVEASKMLRNLRDRGFESSDEKLAMALGRPIEEVEGWYLGGEVIDDDVVMKARGIALQRGIAIE